MPLYKSETNSQNHANHTPLFFSLFSLSNPLISNLPAKTCPEGNPLGADADADAEILGADADGAEAVGPLLELYPPGIVYGGPTLLGGASMMLVVLVLPSTVRPCTSTVTVSVMDSVTVTVLGTTQDRADSTPPGPPTPEPGLLGPWAGLGGRAPGAPGSYGGAALGEALMAGLSLPIRGSGVPELWLAALLIETPVPVE